MTPVVDAVASACWWPEKSDAPERDRSDASGRCSTSHGRNLP